MVLNRLHTKRINENRIIDQQHQGEVINLSTSIRNLQEKTRQLSTQVDGHASRESGRSMHYENAVDDHDTNYDQRQQQAGRSVSRHYAFHQKHQLEGETRRGGQKQHVKGRVWRSSCGAHMQFFSTSTA